MAKVSERSDSPQACTASVVQTIGRVPGHQPQRSGCAWDEVPLARLAGGQVPKPTPTDTPACNNANNCCTPGQKAQRAQWQRERRYALRDRLVEITEHARFAKRVERCGVPGLLGIVRIKQRDGTAYPSGVSTCGSLLCPACAPRIRGRRGEEFHAAVSGWLAKGPDHDAFMVRLSAQNTADLPEKVAVQRAIKGWERLRNRRPWRQLADQYGLHWIRVLEQTHGVNGWNVHLQFVFAAVAGNPGDVLADLLLTLRKLWPDVMNRLGFYADPHVAVHIKQVDPALAGNAGSYLAKPDAWDIGDELARADLKNAGAGRTYEQIVEDFDHDQDPADLALIREHHAALFGRRVFGWSQGFRELLGMAEEQSDEELAASEPEDAEVIAVLDGRTYYAMLRRRQVGTLLNAAERGYEHVREFMVDRLGYPPGSVAATFREFARLPARQAAVRPSLLSIAQPVAVCDICGTQARRYAIGNRCADHRPVSIK